MTTSLAPLVPPLTAGSLEGPLAGSGVEGVKQRDGSVLLARMLSSARRQKAAVYVAAQQFRDGPQPDSCGAANIRFQCDLEPR